MALITEYQREEINFFTTIASEKCDKCGKVKKW